MSKVTLRIIVVAAVVATALGQNLFATTSVAVGPAACQPSLVHFSTIQAAVNAVPFNTTVVVCPGTYPEQVVIKQPLTLKGVTDGIGNAAVITVPAGGLVQNATTALWGPVTAQLVVENTVGVTISDLTVDGTGGTCVAGANREVGILFTNVGAANDGPTAGKVQNSVVRNIAACGLGEGIASDSSYITISSNSVHNVDRTCIPVGRGNTSVTGNSIQGACFYGIFLSFTPVSTMVSQNTLSSLAFNGNGVWVDYGAAGQVTSNVVGPSPGPLFYGIFLGSAAGTKVTGNKVDANGYGIVLNFAFQATVQNNTISEAALGIYDTSSFGGNVVTKNTVNEANFGIFTDNTVGGDTLVPNNLFNVVTTIDPSEPLNPSKGVAF